MIACLTFFGIMTALSGFAQDYIQLSIIRFIAGLGLGGEWALGGTIVSEFFPAEQRSKATSYMMWGWPLGYSITLGFNSWLVPIYGWRALFFAGISSILAALYFLIFVPESPVWQQSQENKRLGIASQSQSTSTAVSVWDLFKGANLKVTLLCTLLCGCALTAYWAQGSWLPTFLAKERGLNIKAMTGFIMGVNVMCFIGYPFFGWVADKFGRRWSLGLGSILAAFAMIVWVNMPDETSFFWMGMLFNFIGQGYWGPLAAFCSEQFPTHLRAFAVSFSYSTGRVIAIFFPMILGAIATATNLAFAFGTLAGIYLLGGIVAFMMKETKGASFETIETKATN